MNECMLSWEESSREVLGLSDREKIAFGLTEVVLAEVAMGDNRDVTLPFNWKLLNVLISERLGHFASGNTKANNVIQQV